MTKDGRRVAAITAIYFLCGCLWILISDYLVGALAGDVDDIQLLQLWKGLGYVAFSSLIIYLLCRHFLGSALTEAERREESERRLRRYFEVSPIAMLVLDENGNYLDANPAACQLSGYSKDELLRRSLFRLRTTQPLEETRQALEQLTTEEKFCMSSNSSMAGTNTSRSSSQRSGTPMRVTSCFSRTSAN